MRSIKEIYKIGRGPSSSHTMGPEFAAADFLRRCPVAQKYRIVLFGSLALTGKGHFTQEAIRSALSGKSVEIICDREATNLPHPNTLSFEGIDENGEVLLKTTYLSVGGGAIKVLGEKSEEREIYPFSDFDQIRKACAERGMGLGELAFHYEGKALTEYFEIVWQTMCESVKRGLSRVGVLPGGLGVLRKAAALHRADVSERAEERERRIVCSYAYAVAEENASGGRIATAPTCGASGVLPAVLLYFAERDKLEKEQIFLALAAAGMIGNVVKTEASISGAEAGCQAEIGTATAMAAAALCSLRGETLEVTEYAAEMSLEHQLGLTCDPVQGFVQIPCIERNAVAALRAIDSASLARLIAGTSKISFDTVVRTMYETGRDLNVRYRETGQGGLAASYKMC